jgi:hypothetical protein
VEEVTLDEIRSRLAEIERDNESDKEVRMVAGILSRFNPESVMLDRPVPTPDTVLPVDREFAAQFVDVTAEGLRIAGTSKVVIVGMARNIGAILPVSFERLAQFTHLFRDWGMVVVENDSTDSTRDELRKFQAAHPDRVKAVIQDLGRPHYSGFEAARVQAYAEYRNQYREIAAATHPDADYILAVDLDPWGGWSIHGLVNGIGWLGRISDAACMASTSLFQHPGMLLDGKPAWSHYDQWGFRAYGWGQRFEPWFNLWLPPPGAHPVEVYSSFGAAALYRAKPFFEHAYRSIEGDIEHVGLHRSMREAGWRIFHNPAQRTLMHWMTDDGGQHSND